MAIRSRRLVVRRRRPAAAKKRYARRKTMRPRFMKTLNSMKQDKATVIEASEWSIVPEGGNTITTQLSQYPRSLAVSANYRFYRCKKVELEFIPYANVYQPGTAFPELYLQVDRTLDYQPPANMGPGISVQPTKASMLAKGVLPVKWTNIIKRSYTPSVFRTENLIQGLLGGNVQNIQAVTATPVKYKWYATQQSPVVNPPSTGGSSISPSYVPANLTYFGYAWYCDQPLAAGQTLGTIKMRVHWEFKQPRSEARDPAITNE